MPRSLGYRPRSKVRAEVQELRDRLGKTKRYEWQKAGAILEQIAALCGSSTGPMGGKINPRCCKRCDYYGHSSDRCPLRYDSEISKEARWKAAQDRHYAERAAARAREVPDGQARWFEQNGIPYVRDPIVGAILA